MRKNKRKLYASIAYNPNEVAWKNCTTVRPLRWVLMEYDRVAIWEKL